MYTELWYRIAVTGDTAPTVTPDADFLPGSTTGGISAFIVGYRNVSTAQPFDVANATGTNGVATTWTPPAVTTNTPRSLVVSVVATNDDNALNLNTANSFAVDAGGTSYHTTTGSDWANGVASKVQAGAGAATMCIWNQSLVGTDSWVGITTALRPANADLVPLAQRSIMVPYLVQ